MSFPAEIPAALVETILAQLAIHFLNAVAGDMTAATQTAREAVGAYAPQNEDEFHLAAEAVSFGLYSLEALAKSSAADLPLTKVLQLRNCAISLTRQSHKSRQTLAQLQKERKMAANAAAAEMMAYELVPVPEITESVPAAVVEKARAITASTSKHPGQSWNQAYEQKMRTQRLTEKMRQNHARTVASQTSAAATA